MSNNDNKEIVPTEKPTDEAIREMSQSRPYVIDIMQTQLLYDIASMLEQRLPEGIIRPIDLSITQKTTVLEPPNEEMPWFAFTIFNDGPSPVFFEVNKDFMTRKASLSRRDQISIDMFKDGIHKLILYCDVGNTAAVRIYAKK